MSNKRGYYDELAKKMAELRSSQVDAPEAVERPLDLDRKCPGLLGIFFTAILAVIAATALINVLGVMLVGATIGILSY